MNSYDPKQLAITGPAIIAGLTVGQMSILAGALIVVGIGALSIRMGWRRGKSISEA